jgi:hypothetical protein
MAESKLLHEWDYGDHHVRVITTCGALILERRCGVDLLGAPRWEHAVFNANAYAEAVTFAIYHALSTRLDEMAQVKTNG